MWQVAVAMTGMISAMAQAIGKRQTARMSAFQSGLIRDMATWGGVILFYLWQGEVRLEGASLVFVMLGLLESVAMAAYYSAQREQMAATAIFSYPFSQLLIIFFSGIIFGEWRYFDIRTAVGVINFIGIVGLVFLMSRFQQKGEGKWSIKLMLSSLVIVGSNLLAKWGVGSAGYSPTEYMFWEYLGVVVGGTIFVYGRGLSLKLPKSDWGWGIVQGLMFAVSALWYVGMLAEHPLSIASVIRRVVIVLMTSALGLWGFGERQALTQRQKWLLAVGVALFGVIIFANR